MLAPTDGAWFGCGITARLPQQFLELLAVGLAGLLLFPDPGRKAIDEPGTRRPGQTSDARPRLRNQCEDRHRADALLALIGDPVEDYADPPTQQKP
ncbi:hypothetical protein CGZ69_00855 [Streptomyces peucetius subsp. caesius ATCC 27952]|nr:hypothetical protein CGZ69_00855 [Streptomyces peucetius subsp. caesius ATCC 27952]